MYQHRHTDLSDTALSGSRLPAPLQFRDSQGRQWTVFERSCKGVPGRRADQCLVFECGEVVRRLWRYPQDWRSLSAVELEKLSWTTGG